MGQLATDPPSSRLDRHFYIQLQARYLRHSRSFPRCQIHRSIAPTLEPTIRATRTGPTMTEDTVTRTRTRAMDPPAVTTLRLLLDPTARRSTSRPPASTGTKTAAARGATSPSPSSAPTLEPTSRATRTGPTTTENIVKRTL